MIKLALLLAVLVGCGGDDGADPSRYHEVARYEGGVSDARAMVLDGDTVYIGHRPGIVALDVSTPIALELGRNNFAQSTQVVQYLFRDGKHVYAGHGDHLSVVDVSDPAAIALRKTVTGNLQSTGDMARIDNVLVFGGRTGLRFFDITDRANPTDTAIFDQSHGSVENFVLDGTTAYLLAGVTTSTRRVVILDLTDPLVGNHEVFAEIPDVYGAMVKSGNKLYTTNLSIVDVSNPAAPEQLNPMTMLYAGEAIAAHPGAILMPTQRNRFEDIPPAVHFYDLGDLADVGHVELDLPDSAQIVKVASDGSRIFVLYTTGLVVLARD